MSEKIRETVYFNLVDEAAQNTVKLSEMDRLTGTFAQAVLRALQVGLSHNEMAAALAIGHHHACRREDVEPTYPLLFVQLDYWEAVYEEAQEHWAKRYRRDEE